MEFETILGYLSGLYFIRPDLAASTLFRTALVIHVTDAVLCRWMAAQGGRNKMFWTFGGLLLGIWALGTLFLLPERKQEK